jgi:RHS repeat-associated protein
MKSTGKLYWYGAGGDVLLEGDPAQTYVYDEHIYFNGQRIARRSQTSQVNSSVYYFFSDHLGTTRIVTDSAGTVVEDSDFYPFGGERVVVDGLNNNYKFTGQERDGESGLDYFVARHYAFTLGRFLQPDPKITSAKRSEPQSWNRYAYVSNNPLIYVDLTGLEKFLVVYVRQPEPGKSTAYTVDTRGRVDAGHAFVGLKDTDAKTESKHGFYPKTGVIPGVQPDAKGQVRDDSNASWTVSKEYEITDEQYSAVKESIEGDIANPPDYNLDTFNCTDWVEDKAANAGVTLPNTKDTWPGGSGSTPGQLGEELKKQGGQTNPNPPDKDTDKDKDKDKKRG